MLEAARRAHAELERLGVIALDGRATPVLATVLWAHVHGLACLLIDGPLAMAFETPTGRQRHLDEVANAFADLLLATGPGAVPAR